MLKDDSSPQNALHFRFPRFYYIPPQIKMQSCVGFIRGIESGIPIPRIGFGNYFTVEWPTDAPKLSNRDNEVYIINMWAENLQIWKHLNPDVEEIQILLLRDKSDYALGVIADIRLLGLTTGRACIPFPSANLARQVCALLGWNEDDYLCQCKQGDDGTFPRRKQEKSGRLVCRACEKIVGEEHE